MTIYKVLTTIEDPCGENTKIEDIKVCKTLSTAFATVMEWANLHLISAHNHLVKVCDGHYTIWANHDTGPDDIYDCWIHEDVIYE